MKFIKRNVQRNYKRNKDVAFTSSSFNENNNNISSNVNLGSKLDRSVWDDNFYTDSNGNLHCKKNFASDQGLTAYAQGDLDIPTIMDGIVTDETTISKEGGILKSINSFDTEKMWEALSTDTNEKINNTHLKEEVWLRNNGDFKSDSIPVTFQGSAANRDNSNWSGSFYGFQCLGTSNSGLIFRVDGGGGGNLSYRIAVDADRWLIDWRKFSFTDTYGNMTDVNNLTLSGQLYQSSDELQKDIIEDISLSLEDITNTPNIKFTWKDDRDNKTIIPENNLISTLEEPIKQVHIGTTAQYIQTILPELVKEDDKGNLVVDYSTTALILAVQTARHLQEINEKLEKRINELERKLYEKTNTMDDQSL